MVDRNVDLPMTERAGDIHPGTVEWIGLAAEDLEEAQTFDPLVAAIARLAESVDMSWEEHMTLLARELLRANRLHQAAAIERQASATPELIIKGESVQQAVAQLIQPVDR